VYSLPFALLLQLSPYSLGWKKEDKLQENVGGGFFFPIKCWDQYIFLEITYLLACLLACFYGYDNVNFDGLLGGFEKALFG
jgi:hypothetical protein